ncbi:MAG TPA: hypothetical protein VGQ97_00135 [Xanthobacteraceae bacterium]|nr:hypothetical protein [Xanthobacteraceae bacterium]
MPPDTLLTFPFVLVRICCPRCMRRGRFRLARLARKYGADVSLASLLQSLTRDCKHRADDDPRRRARRDQRVRCEARYCDLPLPSRRGFDLPEEDCGCGMTKINFEH